MTQLEKMKATAKVENKRMIEHCGGRSHNFGKVEQRIRGSGKPRMSELNRSKPAQELHRLSLQGFTVAEASRITGTPVEDVIRRARRYQLKFAGSDDYG